MRKLFYLFVILLTLNVTFSCSESIDVMPEDSLTSLESSLNLYSPSKLKIADNVYQLKQEIRQALKLDQSTNLELTGVDYFTMKKGYIVTIQYLLNDTQVGTIVKTRNIPMKVANNSKLVFTQLITKSPKEEDDVDGLWSCDRMLGYQKICLECKVVVRRDKEGIPHIECDCYTDCQLNHYK